MPIHSSKDQASCVRVQRVLALLLEQPIFHLYFYFLIITFCLQLNPEEALPSATFWKSRGHRCFPFHPPLLAFIFIVHIVWHSHSSALCARRVSLSFANSRSRAFRSSFFFVGKSPHENEYELDETLNPQRLTLAGTRFTYYPVGDADFTIHPQPMSG